MDPVAYAHSAKQAKRIKRFIENPDSNSGVLTQPKVIEAGETVTIKSGRQAILADTVVDGDLVIEAGGDVFVPAGAGFGDLESQIALKADTSYVNGKYSGFKNYIINGNFDIWQRGISHTTNATINYGSADRWRTANTETTNLVSTRQKVSGVVPFQASYFIRQTVSLNTTYGTVLDQLIEGLMQFSNKTVTLSVWVKGTAGKKVGLALQAQYGTGGSPSINENIKGSIFTLSGDWEKISITRILPDFINGKTYGTNGNDCLRVLIATQINTVDLLPEIFFQSGTFDIAQVQLEEGSVATPFENRPYGLELSLCQRYYEVVSFVNNGVAEGGSYYQEHRYCITKRITPTLTYKSGALGGSALLDSRDSSYFNIANAGTAATVSASVAASAEL